MRLSESAGHGPDVGNRCVGGIYVNAEIKRLIGGSRSEAWTIEIKSRLREAEIKRLAWAEIDLRRRFIEVKAKAKSARRRIVEMQPNLHEWLRPYAGMTGAVVRRMRVRNSTRFVRPPGLRAGRRTGYAIASPRIVWLRLTMRRGLHRSWDTQVHRCFTQPIANWCCRKKRNGIGKSFPATGADNVIAWEVAAK